MYDFIGDIHGYADRLEALLRHLGYEKRRGSYTHPERKVIFLGDYIDRGPQIPETLHLVRDMVEHNQATAIMGNHEYNALCFHFENREGGHLRPHSINNIMQHAETLRQFQHREAEYEDFLEWFLTLPLYYEVPDQFRAVHACWDERHIQQLREVLPSDKLSPTLIYEASQPSSAIYPAVEDTLKGRELSVPEGVVFLDKDGVQRHTFRIKWWENPRESTYQSISVEKIETLPDTGIDMHVLGHDGYYHEAQVPVFFGHYWLKGQPYLTRHNVCCLDFSVAREGKLAAYRLHGETRLRHEHLTFV